MGFEIWWEKCTNEKLIGSVDQKNVSDVTDVTVDWSFRRTNYVRLGNALLCQKDKSLIVGNILPSIIEPVLTPDLKMNIYFFYIINLCLSNSFWLCKKQKKEKDVVSE